jgi:GMP synthase (glutamine-hydrolysing)
MRPLLAITHLADRALGLAERVLVRRGIPLRRTHLDGERPRLDEVGGLLVLGGAMGVPDAHEYPFLRWELELLAEAVAAEVPVLGLCLGGQLLARAAGGGVERMAEPFIGWPRLARLAAAEGDALFGALPAEVEVLEWHNDAIEPPPAAVVLAQTGGPGCSIFRVGPAAWGSQLHLELTPAMLRRWLDDDDLARDLATAGVEPAQLVAAARSRLAAQNRAAETVFERFADLLLARR